ncbi:MAG: ABC transporter permease [Salinivirgaceae bacterium]|nr:ABC transporter permease [Salinivirgaceae bacterium]
MNNHYKNFVRNFIKNKTTNFLNIGGLSIGIALTLLLGWWSINEMNFDNFNTDNDRIYRVIREGFINNETVKIGTVFAPLGREAKARFPQIEEAIKLTKLWKQRFQVGELVNYEESIYLADSNFFQFFTYPIKIGDENTCFNAPNNIVITESFAKKYFPNKNPIGETVNTYDRDWQVSAIMYDLPSTSHLQFDALLAMSGVPNLDNSSWGNRDAYGTYFKLSEHVDKDKLAKNITEMAHESFPPYKQIDIHHFIQPLSDIHLNTESFRFDYALKSDKRFVLIFLFMAIVILVIACINFTNLFISTSFLRAKTIGVKKTNGANRGSLIKEFFIETSLFVLISVLIGIGLAVLFLPLFNQLANSNVAFDFSNIYLYSLLIGITILTILMAGTFPAFYITKFNPITTLKGKFNGKSVSVLQKGLVILQFAASIILLITVVSIKKQVHFVQSSDLGFNKSNIVYVDATGAFSESYQSIKQELERNPAIIEVSAKSCLPSDWNNGNAIASPENRENPYLMEICRISNNYLNMMNIDIIEGENIAKFHDSINYVMINEQAAQVLGLENPIGSTIFQYDEPLIVKGVLKRYQIKVVT